MQNGARAIASLDLVASLDLLGLLHLQATFRLFALAALQRHVRHTTPQEHDAHEATDDDAGDRAARQVV